MSLRELRPFGLSRLNEAVSAFIRRHKNRRTGMLLLLTPAIVTLLFLMVIPTLILVRLSFQPGMGIDGVTFEHYRRVWVTQEYRNIAIQTLRIALAVTVLDLLIGYPLAYAAVRGSKLVGRVIVLSTLAPLTIDLVIRSLGWIILLRESGFVNSILIELGVVTEETAPTLIFNELGIIIGMVHVTLPFMVFPLINILHTIPESLQEAARDLGANRAIVFTHVLLPLTLPGIAAGTLIVFTVTLASYVTPVLLGGGTRVIAVVITRTFLSTSDWAFGSALAALLVLVAVVVILIYQKALQRISKIVGGVGV